MKNVYIIHGWDGNPKEPMLNWLKKELESRNYNVLAPEMPNPGEPEINAWIKKLNEVVNTNDNNIFIGHSVGCQGVLRYIEQTPEKIKISGILLIAPWMELDEETIKEEGEEVIEIARPWMETPIDFKKIKSKTKNITAIFSDDDYFVPLSQKDLFEKELDAKIIVEHNMGHFSPADNVDKLDSALNSVLEIK
ncbi:DUF1749 domain-containing protein [Patescibacteria group bacterium]|nr:DUF1749 domain-containing protein [Patescibacteria group bacterium]MBU4057471.1 DUF1749 domain-containing protein [Patescibacteria group bacterium]MBU4115925.1 DUF1749 domain-containing protein [Patescibacteria group bacterium]